MKGGLGAPKSELSKAPLPSISAYDSLQITNSTNIAGYSSSPIPVSDLDKIDVASLLSPQFGEVNKEAIKSATYQPISMHKIQRDNIFKRIEKVFASFYFKNTVLVKFIMFIVYYIVGVSYYSTEEPWTILER